MDNSLISIAGYDVLGTQGQDGVRYAWKYRFGKRFVESASFRQRSTSRNDSICGYTTSVSVGCALRSCGEQCVFCRTGNIIPYCGNLSYRDIAKQNIFMVLLDMNNEDCLDLRNRPREFAYMGQGEPGLSYTQVRLAIELTNKAMKELGQTVHRHVFATSGIPESIFALKHDIKKYFTQRVTLHFSLHATQRREQIMPVDRRWNYRESLFAMDDLYELTGEKPCVGILLFNNLQPNGKSFSYSNRIDGIKTILMDINPQKFRLSFCAYNPSEDVCKCDPYPPEEANRVLDYARQMGFEAKLFSSFGQEKQAACGTLGGKPFDYPPTQKWLSIENDADGLIRSIDSLTL